MLKAQKDLEALAASWLRAYDNHSVGEVFSEVDLVDFSIEESWQIQRQVVRLREKRGERRIGRKIGCISEPIQKQLNLKDPVLGILWEGEQHLSGISLSAPHYSHLAIEGELAVIVPRPSRESPQRWQWFPVIELHNYCPAGRNLSAQELIITNAMHAGFIRPLSEAPAVPEAELERLPPVRIVVNGQVVEENLPRILPGGPLGSVNKVSELLESRNEHLNEGEIVLTGSPARLVSVYPGDQIKVFCGPYSVEFRVSN